MAKKLAKNSNVIKIDFEGVEGKVLVDEGDYRVKIIEVENRPGNEHNYLAWKFEIIEEGNFEGKFLYNNTSLSPKSLWNLRTLLEAIGEEVPDGVMSLDLDGIIKSEPELFVTVEHEKYEGKKQSRVVDLFAVDAEDEEEAEEKSTKKDKAKTRKTDKKTPKEESKEEAPDFDELDKDELIELIDEHDLDVDADDFPKLAKLRAAVQTAYEEKMGDGGEEGGKDDEKTEYDEDTINEMGTKELQAIVDEAELDIELDGTTKSKRRAVIKALKKKKLLD